MIKLLKKSTLTFLIIFVLVSFINGFTIFAQQNNPIYSGVLKELIREEEVNFGSTTGLLQYFNANIEIDGTLQTIEVENRFFNDGKSFKFKVGDNVYIMKSNISGVIVFNAIDYIRTPYIFILLFIFAFITILIAGYKGFRSLLSLIISFALILLFVLPSLLSGADPIFLILLISVVIIFFNYYLAHGFSKKTTVAIAGTVITLVITILFADLFVNLTRLTGFASEESNFLDSLVKGAINIRALLMAGIIIGIVGIMDDITISQSSIAYELKLTDKNLKWKELYSKTMKIGKDHIASVVNTLILVYTSASLPLLMLFINSKYDFLYILNIEIVAEEVVRTLVTSSGLILAVPITTLIASLVFARSDLKEDSKHSHSGHSHVGHSH